MNSVRKQWCLALAIALASAGLSAAETPAADQDQVRKELRDAQRQLAEISKRVAELSLQVGGDPARVQMFRYLGNPDRAVIGLILGETTNEGERVNGVTPGGPADKAGLRAGDTLTAIGGKSLAGDDLVPGLRGALKDLKDGDEVLVDYLRDGKALRARIIAERQGSFESAAGLRARAFMFESGDTPMAAPLPPDFDQQIETIVERAIGEAGDVRVNVMAMTGMGGLRLTSLNAGLGRYFGATEGALVLEVDSERYKGLQAGDVILEIDGKPVKDPRDAMRELSRQDPQRPVELKLQRDRVPQLVKVSVPEKSRAFIAPPAPPAPPLPPSARSAPRATPSAAPQPMAAPAPLPPAPPASSLI